MSGTERIKAKILEDAEARSGQILEQANAEAREIIEECFEGSRAEKGRNTKKS